MLIVVNLQYAALHSWPGAMPPVSYLKFPHRHVFHICCKKAVKHNDRDIEIIQFKELILNFLNDTYNGNLGSRSCEHLAQVLLNKFKLTYCCVLEDGENGAEITQQ